MPPKFDLGDLIILNGYGVFITPEYDHKIGIIIAERYTLMPDQQDEVSPMMNMFFLVYDILLDGELFKMVAEEFMEKYNLNEKYNV